MIVYIDIRLKFMMLYEVCGHTLKAISNIADIRGAI